MEMPSLTKLLTPSEARSVLGFRTKTNHTLRGLELRGLLRPIRINVRTLRYDPNDLAKLIAEGKTS